LRRTLVRSVLYRTWCFRALIFRCWFSIYTNTLCSKALATYLHIWREIFFNIYTSVHTFDLAYAIRNYW